MEENKENEIDITKKDDYITEVAELKKKYKVEKEKIEWADDDWEEASIQEEMDKYATKIRALNRQIASIEQVEKNA
ncbi:MAG TPA: hypothetical protein EYG95_01295 [Campylobacterales bacterium]|nr:hypothetical protein [Campylobacterales bacterium]